MATLQRANVWECVRVVGHKKRGVERWCGVRGVKRLPPCPVFTHMQTLITQISLPVLTLAHTVQYVSVIHSHTHTLPYLLTIPPLMTASPSVAPTGCREHDHQRPVCVICRPDQKHLRPSTEILLPLNVIQAAVEWDDVCVQGWRGWGVDPNAHVTYCISMLHKSPVMCVFIKAKEVSLHSHASLTCSEHAQWIRLS